MSGVSGDELDGLRWRIEFKVFQSVRGLEDDSVTRFVRKLDLALEIRDLTNYKIALGSEFLAVKGRFPATPWSFESTSLPFSRKNFGINPWCMGSEDNNFWFEWGMDVEYGIEGWGELLYTPRGNINKDNINLNYLIYKSYDFTLYCVSLEPPDCKERLKSLEVRESRLILRHLFGYK